MAEDVGRAFCIKCNTNEHTKCVDDMLYIGYVSEAFVCKKCAGSISIVYTGHNISKDEIKSYFYLKGND